MLRELTSTICLRFGRPLMLKRGATTVEFHGVIRGLRPDELVQSAEQSDALCVLPAEQITGLVPKKFDRIIGNGREYTVQFVRECYDGATLTAYKALIRG